MRNRTVGINVRVTVTEKKKVTMLARKYGRDIRISAKEVEKLLSRLFFLLKNSKEGGRHHEV